MVFRFSFGQGLARPPARRWAERLNWSLGFGRNNWKLTIKLYHKITEEFGF
jgi:outer membrane phospholipase A